MRKKLPKDPLERRWAKLRAAIRAVWHYDISHKEAISKASYFIQGKLGRWFRCAICHQEWPVELASPDHIPPLGSFDSWETFFGWTRRCFEGPTQIVCKPCHKRKPRKAAKNASS